MEKNNATVHIALDIFCFALFSFTSSFQSVVIPGDPGIPDFGDFLPKLHSKNT